jgi:hypothetical protein
VATDESAQPDTETVGILSRQTNSWVIQLPGRSFPAVAVQGDSLKILYDLVEELSDFVQETGDTRDTVLELREQLRSYLESYERAMVKHGLRLPYRGPVTLQ